MGRKRAGWLLVLLALTGLLAAPAEAVVYEGADAAVVVAVSEGAMTPRATTQSYGARVTETALGDLTADAFRQAGQTDVAIACGGHLGNSLPGGTITLADVYQVFAVDGQVVSVTITAGELYDLMEQTVSGTAIDGAERIDPARGSDAFPQASGFSFTYDISQVPGRRMVEIRLEDGTELDPAEKRTLTLAAPAELLGGTLGVTLPGGGQQTVLGREAELTAAYLAGQVGTVARPRLGRMTVIGTADHSLYRSWNVDRCLPYLLLACLLVALLTRPLHQRLGDRGRSKMARYWDKKR